LAFGFASLSATLLLGVALTMLEGPLLQLAQLREQNLYPLGPVYSVLTLVLVFAGVSAGMLVAGAMMAGGVRLPRGREPATTEEGRADVGRQETTTLSQPRAVRVAAAAAALDRRDAVLLTGGSGGGRYGGGALVGAAGSGGSDRRTVVTSGATAAAERGTRDAAAPETRLGQAPRRSARPRPVRAGARRAQ
jgi:hypothetical protein